MSEDDRKVGEYWIKHINNHNFNYAKDYIDPTYDYTDAVVLDLGASFHTPDFFIDHGAKHVVAIDCDEERMKTIIAYAEKIKGTVTPITTKIMKPEQLTEL